MSRSHTDRALVCGEEGELSTSVAELAVHHVVNVSNRLVLLVFGQIPRFFHDQIQKVNQPHVDQLDSIVPVEYVLSDAEHLRHIYPFLLLRHFLPAAEGHHSVVEAEEVDFYSLHAW